MRASAWIAKQYVASIFDDEAIVENNHRLCSFLRTRWHHDCPALEEKLSYVCDALNPGWRDVLTMDDIVKYWGAEVTPENEIIDNALSFQFARFCRDNEAGLLSFYFSTSQFHFCRLELDHCSQSRYV